MKIAMVRGMEKLYVGTYNRFRKALGNVPHELPDQEELKNWLPRSSTTNCAAAKATCSSARRCMPIFTSTPT